MTTPRKHHQDHMAGEALERAREPGGGGRLATIISALALIFSGYSFYEAVLRAPELATYVPPRIAYTDPDSPGSPFEVFIIPLTLANDGARTGTVLSLDMTVTNTATGERKRFYSAQVGPWGKTPLTAYAPVSLPGRTSQSQAIQFFPLNDEKVARITNLEGGTYAFEIRLNTAAKRLGVPFLDLKAQPLKFTMEMGRIDYRRFNGPGTIELRTPDNKPVAAPAQ